MGTWDIGFFDNDMACDWENGLENNKTFSYIESALKAVIEDQEETLDIDIANKCLAASDALAKLCGNEGTHSSYTEHIDNWAKNFNEEIPDDLLNLAKEAIAKVISPSSEIFQFRTIRGEKDKWLKNIEDLKLRLNKK